MTARDAGLAAGLAAALALLAGCEMKDQPKLEPLEASAFFRDGRASRNLPPGTVPRGTLPPEREGEGSPWPWTKGFLRRGRERYDVFCAPCHDRAGTGRGMAVQRGFQAPPSLHEPSMRALSDAAIEAAVANGAGTMAPMRGQVPERDRWAVVGYVRALQRSRRASLDEVPEAERRRLLEAPR